MYGSSSTLQSAMVCLSGDQVGSPNKSGICARVHQITRIFLSEFT